MTSRPFAALILVLACATARAQSGPLPRSTDAVLLARVYRTTPEGTDPVARLGIVLQGKASKQSVEIPAAAGEPPAALVVEASRKGDGARASWTLGAETGQLTLPPGALSRVSLRKWSGGELFASFEAGRASSFESFRLAQHFGAYGMPGQQPEPMGVAPVLVQAPGGGLSVVPASALAAAQAPSDRPMGPSLEVECASGSRWTLALSSGRGECRTKLGDDGEVLGAACKDADGNACELDCRATKGRGACIMSSGSGSCHSKK